MMAVERLSPADADGIGCSAMAADGIVLRLWTVDGTMDMERYAGDPRYIDNGVVAV